MKQEGRHWSGYVYYYGAALIGLSFVLFGAVSIYTGLIQAALPRSSPEYQYRRERPTINEPRPVDGQTPMPTASPEEVRRQEVAAAEEIRSEGFYSALNGLGAAIIGLPTFVWHLRRARRREADDADGGLADARPAEPDL